MAKSSEYAKSPSVAFLSLSDEYLWVLNGCHGISLLCAGEQA